jgi:hypothetical protein
MKTGVCKLTGNTGAFVKPHIIPKAFTATHDGKNPLTQAGIGVQPIRRWDSSYDTQLVIRDDEDILEKYDAFAVSELRNHKLVWSSWGPMISVCTDDLIQIDETHGMRRITGINTLQLRMFFLSLLWRASASK